MRAAIENVMNELFAEVNRLENNKPTSSTGGAYADLYLLGYRHKAESIAKKLKAVLANEQDITSQQRDET